MKIKHNYILLFICLLLLFITGRFLSGCSTTTDTTTATTTTSIATTSTTTNTTTTTLAAPRIVAVGDASTGSSTIIYSDNYGATWTSVSETVYREDLNCVVHDGLSGRYYAAGDDGKILYSNSSGTFWSAATGTSDSDDEFYGIASDGNGKLVAVGVAYNVWGPNYYGPVRYRNLSGSTYYNYLVHSSDELAGNSLNSGYLYGVTVDDNSRFVAVGKRVLSNPTETISVARYSTDGGANWTENNANATIGIGATVQLRDVAATQSNTFYAVGDSGTFVKTENGGTIWSSVEASISPSVTLYGIASNSNASATTMVIVGSGGSIIRGSKSGASWSWENVPSGTTNTLIDVATDGNGNWVAVGTFGKVIYSTNDAVSWEVGTSGISYELYGVAFGD